MGVRQDTTFEAGALLAVNLGDDADTTGAIYGQIAGARCGVEGIPARWREKLAGLETLERLADALWRGAEAPDPNGTEGSSQRRLEWPTA